MRPTPVPARQFFEAEPPVIAWPALLAEGDSWFTLGELPGPSVTNLLLQLDLGASATAITAAYPGQTLQHMVDGMNDPHFDRLLRDPAFAMSWSAIVVSAGGNDLIDAAGLPTRRPDGTPALPADRLLLAADETAVHNPGVAGPARWISEPGWSALASYLRSNLATLVQRRDSGPAAGRPLVLHTYAVPTVWAWGIPLKAPDGWLYPALTAAGLPAADQQGVATELFQRLRALLRSVDSDGGSDPLPQVHVFDSAAAVQLVPPDPAERRSCGDWANEIHPNRAGYRKIGRAMGAWLDGILARYA